MELLTSTPHTPTPQTPPATPATGFWLRASPARALGETLLLALTLTVSLIAMQAPDLHGWNVLRINPSLILLDGPCCALWCATRLRLPRAPWQRWLPLDATISGALSLLPATIFLLTVYLLAQRANIQLDSSRATIRGFTFPVYATLIIFGFGVEYIFFRIAVRLWLWWRRLGRAHLSWSLTNALLTVAALGAGTLITLLVLLLLLLGNHDRAPFTILIPFIFFLLVLSVIGLLILLPPAALFSYLFASRITRRVHALTHATNALRSGDYSTRINVIGEDEIAQLQRNFNAMAIDLERAMRELRAERDTVATLLRARRELIANVSHELRTPIATLQGYLESSRAHWATPTDAPPPTLRHDLDIMEHEAQRLHRLIDDLFALARAEIGKLDLHIEPTDIAALVTRIAETAAPLAWQSARVEIIANTPAHSVYALVDSSRLEQAASNLLQNALRHTAPGGIVALYVTDQPTHVTLEVKDTGEGIPPTELPHIWDRFYRTQQARAQGSGGAGLGLALVKELTEAMGGSVSVESALSVGSNFALHLPHAATPPPTAQPPAITPPRHTTPPPTASAPNHLQPIIH